MIDTITPATFNTITRGGKVIATSGGNFAAYVDLSNMEAGDSIIFFLEYDVAGQDAPIASGTAIPISYEDLVTVTNEGGEGAITVVTNVWALEPVALQAGQVSQIALAQISGTLKSFPVRNTNMATNA